MRHVPSIGKWMHFGFYFSHISLSRCCCFSSRLLQFPSSSSKQTNDTDSRQFLDVVSLPGCYSFTALPTNRHIIPIAGNESSCLCDTCLQMESECILDAILLIQALLDVVVLSSRLLEFPSSSSKQTNATDNWNFLGVIFSLLGSYNFKALPVNRQKIPNAGTFFRLLLFHSSFSKQTNNADSSQCLYVVYSIPGYYNFTTLSPNRRTMLKVDNIYRC